MLNAIGFRTSAKAFIGDKLPTRQFDTKVIVNIFGETLGVREGGGAQRR
jgi:hypothetical protein